MKKITLLVTFFTFALNAQNFPAPYCDIIDPDAETELITTVNFNNVIINNTISNSLLVDFTATQMPVSLGQPYLLKVFGNTFGDFTSNIVAFIDWNNNGILDDDGEVYEVGTLTNTTGADGVFASLEITVPATATLGSTRVRISKVYTDEDAVAVIDPCAISFDIAGFGTFGSYGQALDFTLNVATLSSSTFDTKALSIYPVPAKNKVTINYKSAIGNMQVYNQLGQEVHTSHNLGSEVDLDISNFATGVYFIKLFNNAEEQTFRIIKD